MDKKGKHIRKTVQSVFGILQNGYLKGFIDKTIYKGALKHFCVPGMNCYSCPGALGACPIGALQALFDGRKRKAGLYVIGFLAFLGMLVGRFVCGWLCLFGLIQELLYKLPTPKLKVPEKLDRILRFAKYVFLLLFVVVLPLLWRNSAGAGDPFFCKYICPAGTLEGGIPLVLFSDSLKKAVGLLFGWKMLLLVLIILLSVFVYRPFCKYICPLGAFYALFQKISFLQLNVNKDVCTNCGACTRQCKMDVNVPENPNSTECIRCGECVETCPHKALTFGMNKK